MMISGTLIAIAFFVIILVSSIIVFRRPYIEDDEEVVEHNQKPVYGRMLSFNIVSNSDETLELDLCNLDSSSPHYSFFTSDGDYKKLVEYLKSYTLNVIGTKVQYDNRFWHKDIIKSRSYSPFDSVTKPIYIAIDDYDTSQIQERLIISKDKYQFDYFHTLIVKVKPKETKNITLLISEDEVHNEEMPVVCGICIKNNSDKPQKVTLFNKKENSDDIEITSLFDSTDYQTILNMFDSKPLITSKIRVYAQNNIKGVLFRINYDENHRIAVNQAHKEIYDIDLKDPMFIARFEIEVEAKSESIVIFK